MKPDIGNAIRSLGYKANFGIKDGKITDWDISQSNKTGETQPSEDVINNKLKELQAEYDTQEYARNRKAEYPDLAEQLDLLWHAIDTDTLDNKDYRNKFYTMLKKVKEDNPKG